MWRTYAARAAAAFTLALIEKVGGRWQGDGPVTAAVRELEAKRKVAQDHFNANEFEQCALLAEECIPLAQRARRTDLEIQTRLWSARAWGEHLVAIRADSDTRERERVLARIDEHVRVAGDLGAAPIDLARERARTSLLKRDSNAALAAARHAIELADRGSREWVDALIMMLQACWQLDSYDEPMRLVGDISEAIAAATDGDIRLVLAATWLGTFGYSDIRGHHTNSTDGQSGMLCVDRNGTHITCCGAGLSPPHYAAREPAPASLLLGRGPPRLPRPDERVVQTYCLMPNHVHLVVVPESEGGLRRAIARRIGSTRGA